MQAILRNYAVSFQHLPLLHERLMRVLFSLPTEVQEDFAADSTFQIVLERYQPGRGSQLFMSLPNSSKHVSRCVVLRGKLDRAPEDFATYIIAHELAHAFLRNGGWGEIQDAEQAADALATHWGYPPPARRWF